MAVISELIIDGENITEHEYSTISNINVDGVDYNFAKSNEVLDGVCENAVNEPLINMQISGNSSQQTYTGKNLLNTTLWETEVSTYGITIKYLKDEDCFVINGTPQFDSNFGLKYINIPITKNEIFSLSSIYVSGSIIKPSGSFAVAYFGKNDESGQYTNWTNVPISTSENKKENQICDANYITAFWFYVTSGVVFDNYKVKIQLERGSKATDYEHYVGGKPIPNPENPQEIQSVGDRTSNLLDLSKVTARAVSPHVTFDYNNLTGSMILTSTPTKYDYTSVTPEELGISLEIGKTYHFSCDVTVSGKQTTNSTAIAFYIRYDGSSAKSIYPTENGTYHLSDTLTYTGQTGIYFAMFFNYGSPEPAQVRFDNIYFSEVDEFEPYGYKVPVKVRGKNLLPINDYEGVVSWIGISHPTYTKVEVTPNTKYTFSAEYFERLDNIDGGNIVLYIYGDSNLSEESRISAIGISNSGNVGFNTTPYEYTFDIGDYTEIYCVLRNNMGTNINIKINGMMLRKADTSKGFEPYVEPITTNIYLKEPLRKIGDYTDYIDYKNKKVVRNIGKYIPTGDEGWSLYNTTDIYQMYTNTNVVSGNGEIGVYSNITPFGATVYNRTEFDLGAYLAGQGTQLCFQLIGWTTTMTVDEWIEYLKANDVRTYYVLATPTEETIDIPEISTFKGTNIFDTDTTIKPSEIRINYWKQI